MGEQIGLGPNFKMRLSDEDQIVPDQRNPLRIAMNFTWDTIRFQILDHATTGSKQRSLCSLVCKWTYRGQNDEKGTKGWDQSYFQQIGLDDLCNKTQGREKFDKIGIDVITPGEIVGDLDEKAARELGLQLHNDTIKGIDDLASILVTCIDANPTNLDSPPEFLGITVSKFKNVDV